MLFKKPNLKNKQTKNTNNIPRSLGSQFKKSQQIQEKTSCRKRKWQRCNTADPDLQRLWAPGRPGGAQNTDAQQDE